MYSLAQQRLIHDNIHHYARPALDFLQPEGSACTVTLLPSLLVDIRAMFDDLLKEELHLDPLLFRNLKLFLHTIFDDLYEKQGSLESLVDCPPAPPGQTWILGDNGYHRLDIDLRLLRELAEEGATDEDIAQLLGCGLRTVQRRRKEAGIRKRDYTEMSDGDLHLYIERVLHMGSGEEGEKGVLTGLHELGVHAPRDRVRAILRLIPRGPLAVPPRPITRRVYRVPWINSLWHLDGHHKLIRWKIVIHGAIDGFSRMITFCRASDNNRAETVGQAFEEAVREYGWPSRVRADQGKENWEVMAKMEERRGKYRGSFIAGTSTHNQRIERLWVDLQRWCTRKYHKLFAWMEEVGILFPDRPLDLWALHFCYLPMLNTALAFFQDRWNRHGLRTERQNSPRLIWMKSFLQARQLGMNLIEDPLAVLQEEVHDEEISERATSFDWVDYGTEGYRQQSSFKPQDSDPYVEVRPVLSGTPESVGEWLASDSLQQKMRALAGRAWPPPDDFGVNRYRVVLAAVYEEAEERFPDLWM